MFGTQQPLQQQQQPQFQQQQQQQQQFAPNANQQFAENFAKSVVAVSRPKLYGDERDQIVAKFNQLLADAGCGKGYYDNNSTPVDFNLDNLYCRFKAVGYNRLSGHKNVDGLLGFIVKKNANDVENMRQQFIDGIFKIMGSKPNLALEIKEIRPLPNERCEVVAFITEASAINHDVKRRIPALESYNFFMQATIKTQIEQGLQVASLAPKVDPSTDKLEEYLASPPHGIDKTIWMQAQRDNPDPSKLVPWPILGFTQLRERQIMQQQEAERQRKDINELLKKTGDIEEKTLTSQARLAQLKTSEDQMSHRVLKIVATILRRSREGHALDANEELLHNRLESVFLRLNGPLQIKGRLSELLSQFRSRNFAIDQSVRSNDDVALTSTFVDETKIHLKKYQDGLEKLVEITQNDLKDLDVIEDALKNKDRLGPRK